MSNISTYPVTPNLQLVYVSNVEYSTAFYKFIFKKEPVFISPRYVAFASSGDALFALWSGGMRLRKMCLVFQKLVLCCLQEKM